jgi:hypothetical protein
MKLTKSHLSQHHITLFSYSSPIRYGLMRLNDSDEVVSITCSTLPELLTYLRPSSFMADSISNDDHFISNFDDLNHLLTLQDTDPELFI